MKNTHYDLKDQAYTMSLDYQFWFCDYFSDDEKNDLLGIWFGKNLKKKKPWSFKQEHIKRHLSQMKKIETEYPNPFINEKNMVPVRKSLSRSGRTITNYFLTETDSIVSIYPKPMKELLQMFSGQTSALATILHIMTNMKCYKQSEHTRFDIMYVDLSFGTFRKQLGIKSLTTVNKVLQQLIENKLISPKNDIEYWVNHNHIFPGSRVKFFENFYPDFINVTHTS